MSDNLTNSSSTSGTSGHTDFVPPRHWVGPEELDASYWGDPAVLEKRSQEFYEKPVELIDQIDRSAQGGLARRDFMTIMGASVAMGTMACARRPVHKIIPYVVKPEEITPGVANHYATTCQECSTGCGVVAKTREGRPIKLEGNPEHPVNRGSLCARGQASILSLYDPDRLRSPVMRTRPGQSHDVTWTDADAAIVAKLKAVAAAGGRVRILTGAVNSESTLRLIREFLSVFRAGEHIEFEAIGQDDVVEGQLSAYGTPVVPRYRFDQAKMVVSLGADFLGTWGSPIEHARDWGKSRKLDKPSEAAQKFGKLIVFESAFSITGASADDRIAVRPGDEARIALALAHEIVKRSSFASDATITTALAPFKAQPEYADAIHKAAEALWHNRGKSIVVGGGLGARTEAALGLQLAVNLLNSALGNEGVTVDGTHRPSAYRASFAAFSKLLSDMKKGAVDALVVYRSNPAYTMSGVGFEVEEAIKKVPFVVSISDREDETALLSDYVLPDNHSLESWGDANPVQGVFSLQQPTIAPIHDTRSFQDTLLAWIKGGLVGTGLAKTAADWHDYVMTNWRETIYRQSASAATFEQFWEGSLRAGVVDLNASGRSSARSFKASSLGQLPRAKAVESEQILLSLYPKVAIGDGRSANNAWLQEMPDPITSITWDNYLLVGPTLAKKLNVKTDDVVEVTSGNIKAELPVRVQAGIHPQTVAVAVGYGRRAAGKVGTEAGVDVYPFVQADGPHLIYSGHPVKIRRTERFYRLAAVQWHTVTENRPIINDITVKEFEATPGLSNHTDPHLRMETVPSLWPEHTYTGHRWGMAIDLTSCIGCGACVIGCQAENNIPVVGRDQVRNSRAMHWIKIDRYFSGSPENPDTVFQPMLCQHCENAPCETVCPVLATVHDDEGLNVQVYNRCVGTRYCQNNCPYKVRRFNFFDHWKSYEGPMSMAWNPEVTVRTRGIMEKCTFCTQRIRDAKDTAKDAGERVQDGQIKTACQQTCPTDAIVFGDMNDPTSRVAKLKKDPRAFRVLEVLNTKPAINYLTKVRNKEGTSGHHGGGGAEHHE